MLFPRFQALRARCPHTEVQVALDCVSCLWPVCVCVCLQTATPTATNCHLQAATPQPDPQLTPQLFWVCVVTSSMPLSCSSFCLERLLSQPPGTPKPYWPPGEIYTASKSQINIISNQEVGLFKAHQVSNLIPVRPSSSFLDFTHLFISSLILHGSHLLAKGTLTHSKLCRWPKITSGYES